MSINGVLEDLPLADVLQFVHLGRRTGTLYMWIDDDDQQAEIGFHDGKIVSAWTPNQRKLGDLLVAAGLLEPAVLGRLLQDPRLHRKSHTLGQLLLESDLVARRQIHDVIREQVKATIFELVTWRKGNFHFEIDELNPVDDLALAPGEILQDLDLNTQMLLLEAARVFDEQRRGKVSAKEPAESELDRRLHRAGLGRAPTQDRSTNGKNGRRPRHDSPRTLEAIRCQVVSDDKDLLALLRSRLPQELVKVVSIRLREAGNRFPGESEAPIVLMDLRQPDLSAASLAGVARTRPAAPLIALASNEQEAVEARKAGAVAALLPGDDSLADCVRNLVRVFSHPTPKGTFGSAAKGGFSRFRRVVFDVQSGLLSATMALNLMHVISESVERAMLFLVQEDTLVACGAFGFAVNGEPLATATRNLRWRLEPGSVMQQALEQAQPVSVRFDRAGLPDELAAKIGRPAYEEVVLFPVLGAERPISLIYTDNGNLDEEIQDIRILELATSQVGVAFENELLRQRLGDLGLTMDSDSFLEIS